MSEDLIDYNEFEGNPIQPSHGIRCLSTPYHIYRELNETESFTEEHLEQLRKQIVLRKKCMKGLEEEIEDLEGMIEDIEDKLT